jgi:hypothetical protein
LTGAAELPELPEAAGTKLHKAKLHKAGQDARKNLFMLLIVIFIS